MSSSNRFNSSRSNSIGLNAPEISDYSDLYDEYMTDDNLLSQSRIGPNSHILDAQKTTSIQGNVSDFIPYTREQLLERNLHQSISPEADQSYEDDEDDESSTELQIPVSESDRVVLPQSSKEWQEKGAAQILRKVKNADGQVSTELVRKSIKNFKLGKELGEGSYSTVVLATDLTTGRFYAIKVLHKRHIIKEKKVKYVNIEKNALNRLGSGHGIIHLFYTFQDEQSLYFVLDYAPNGELLSLIKKHGTMDEESVKYYSTQLVDAIDYMHSNGVIHRDIKPENILLDTDMKIKVTDFGTAKMLEKNSNDEYPSDTRASSFVGTAEYVSPELLNDKYCGKGADIWALGCIIYQMIAGKPPFKATNEYLTFQKILKLQYAFSAGFPMVIRDLVKRILILKPKDRISLPEIKKHYFFRGVDWSNQESIWDSPPPELGPYKMSAKSMLPVPDLNKSKLPPASATVKRLGSAGKSASATNVTSASTSSSPNMSAAPTLSSNNGTIFGLPNPLEYKKVNSSPVLPTEKTVSSQPLSTAAAVATTKKLLTQPTPKLFSASGSPKSGPVKSDRSEIARHDFRPPQSSSGPKLNTKSSKVGLSSTASNNSIAKNVYSSSAYAPPNISKTSSSTLGSSPASTISSASIQPRPVSSQQKVDVIPGTNIPRPVINTRINTTGSFNRSSSSSGMKSKQPTLSAITTTETPPLSILDMAWVKFLIHPDERVLRAGIVHVSKYSTEAFEKKYKGTLTESPLGYKNRELLNSSNPGMLGQASTLRKSSVISAYSEDDAITFTEEEAAEKVDDEDNSKDNNTSERISKLKNLFHYKALSTDPIAKQRTLVVTSFGRALLFIENHDRNKEKYQCVSEIDLVNSYVHFREVIGDRRSRNLSSGIFAIVSVNVTLAFEVDKQELSLWTNSLAKARFMQQERSIRLLMEKDPAGDSGMATGNQAASRAANMAMSPTDLSPKLPSDIAPGSPLLDFDLLSGPDPHNRVQSRSSSAGKPIRKPPPGGTGQFPSSMRAESEINNSKAQGNRKSDPNTRKVLSENSPMISAAINKALWNSSQTLSQDPIGAETHHVLPQQATQGNSTIASSKNGSSPRLVTSMNSKLLARTTRKRR
ncbi:hypothetical protein OGAPHI_003516 [Ogataea philodendri]|uniref:non-specific serine/threonine protein kinase n=1 Tax=Ogataea philodendri TaxID=1378263 RepID=A0A9P8P7M6_9ASCO|nr:uncharacterized protein OGAPHI_003516 [Ogataea philodendri]KAH3666520.1 hypothetical protein OGAPHI_003516 [Ogataea philodendri]